jgi:hypothetical protein
MQTANLEIGVPGFQPQQLFLLSAIPTGWRQFMCGHE